MPSYTVQFTDSFDDSSLDANFVTEVENGGSITETTVLTIDTYTDISENALMYFNTPLARGGEWAIEATYRMTTNSVANTRFLDAPTFYQKDTAPVLGDLGQTQLQTWASDSAGSSWFCALTYISTVPAQNFWNFSGDSWQDSQSISATRSYDTQTLTIRAESDATNFRWVLTGVFGSETTDNVAWTDIRDNGEASLWCTFAETGATHGTEAILSSFTYEAPDVAVPGTPYFAGRKALVSGLMPGLRLL